MMDRCVIHANDHCWSVAVMLKLLMTPVLVVHAFTVIVHLGEQLLLPGDHKINKDHDLERTEPKIPTLHGLLCTSVCACDRQAK